MLLIQRNLNRILNLRENQQRHKQHRLQLYGMNASEAFKKAWSEVEHGSQKTASNVTKQWKKALSTVDSGKGIQSLFGNAGNGTSTLLGNLDGTSVLLGNLGKIVKSIGMAVGAAFSVRSIVNFTKECLNLGSDLSEVQNVVDVTFGSMSSKVDKFAETTITQFGLSETAAKKMMGTYGAMNKAFGFSEAQTYDMAKAVTELTADVASFYNLETDEAAVKMKSIWTGETETLKDLGVVMTQTALDQYAMNNGFGKTTAKMTEQEKVMLRYQFVMSQLSDASGDFARTSDGWANQTRVLQLQLEQIKATLGQGFINLFTPIIKMVNNLLAKLQAVANAFKHLTELLTGKKADESGGGGVKGVAEDADDASDGLSDMEKAAKKAQKQLMGFDKINKLSDTSSSGSSSGGSSSGVDVPLLDSAAEAAEKTREKLSATEKAFRSLKKLFQAGFKLGFGEHDFDGLHDSINRIKQDLRDIFSSKEVQKAAGEYTVALAECLGKMSGSVASIGTTLMENVIGGARKYLDKNSGKIKQWMANVFTINADSFRITGDFSAAVANIFSAFGGENGQNLTAAFMELFGTAFMGVTELGATFGHDLLDAICSPITDNQEMLKEDFDDLLAPCSEIIQQFADDTEAAFDDIKAAYQEYVKPTLKDIKDEFDRFLKSDFHQDLKDITESLKEMSGKLKELHQALKPVLDPLMKINFAAFSNGLRVVSNVFMFLVKQLTSGINNILTMLNGLLDFVIGVFTGDWKRAFEGCTETAEGWSNGLLSLFDTSWKDIKNGSNTAGKNAAGGFRHGMRAEWPKTKSYLLKTKDDAAGAFDSLPDDMENTSKNAWERVKSAISTGKTKEHFSSVASNAKTGISSMPGSFNSTAKNAWKNMTNRISTSGAGNHFFAVADAIKNMMSGLPADFLRYAQNMWANVSGTFNQDGIRGYFTGIANTIRSCFTQIGTDVGNATSSAFRGIMNAVFASVENIVNRYIRSINSMIRSIKSMRVFRNVTGGLSELDEITLPRLAQGGYVKPNTPQLAMIGDNRHQGEVVAPEDKLQELLNNAVAVASGGTMTAEVVALLKEILAVLKALDLDIVIDGRKLKDIIVSKINEHTQATGVCEIIT